LATLYIIAGPNGAGKSTNSKALLGWFNFSLTAFDYDKELYATWKRFGFDPAVEEGVRDSVGRLFSDRKNSAIAGNADFAFETNYHDAVIQETVFLFREAGYQTVLLFLALPDEEIAIERVKRRVALGGHSVDEQTIRERYQRGLLHLDQTFDLFDQVYLLLSNERQTEPILAFAGKEKIFHVESIPHIMRKLPRLQSFIRSAGEGAGQV
jgi:predicted ABC-type ATPase